MLSSLRQLNVKLWADGDRLHYRAPQGTLTPTLRAELAERKAEILAFLHQAYLTSFATWPPIQPVSRDGSLPLSFAQQRLWFLDQLEPGSSVYNLCIAVRFTGVLHVAVLEQSLREIVRRHDILRTTFPDVQGQPSQVIAPDPTLTLPLVDLRYRPAIEWETEVQRIATEESQRPFDLAQGPLLRVKLLYLDETLHVLVLTTHNMVYDGWSHDVFLRELVALYDAFSTGTPSPLPELPIQYVDVAVWQRQWLQGEVLEPLYAYWKRHLDGCPAMLALPTDRVRRLTSTSRSSRHILALPAGLTAALNALSRREGVTLFMTLLAAFKTLLHRYTGQEDLIVGSPSAGRDQVDTEGLIGFFVNTLVLRTDLAGSPTFRELLARVRDVCLGAYAHQTLPFEKLVEALQPERDLHRNPLFQVFFNFVRFNAQQTHLKGLTVAPILRFVAASKFDLTLYTQEQDHQIRFELIYKTDLFEPSRMVEMLEQLQQLLQQIVANPDQPITSYSLVTPRSAPLLPDPHVALPEPQYASVTQRFAALAERLPAQPAVRHGDHTWTYKTLLDRATTLAQVLLASGLNRGEVVAVVGSTGFGLYASVIGILMSGGVLLTVEATLPASRKRLMLREAGVKRLVWLQTQHPEEPERDDGIRELEPRDRVHMDPDTGRTVEAGRFPTLAAIPLPHLAPDDAAYVFFTSGTTGVPKGILGSHKGLNHFLSWQRETFEVRPLDRCAQLTTLSFDALLRDVFLPLTSGALLCVPEADDLSTPRVWEWLERQRISLLHAVPTVVQSWLVDVPAHISLRALRWVFFSGEPLTDALVHQWRRAFPETGGVVNFYGPTETTMIKCFNVLPADLSPGVQPVGRPLPETQALVLGQHQQLCGIGEIGEIVLRTPFRTLGYLNAPEETRRRFVRNPFREADGDLLYHTGDSGRYRPDGSLDILGRCDQQVKVRGVRVEPDEVTAVLAQHPSVQSCIVVPCKTEEDQSVLVAYVVVTDRNSVTRSDLGSYLRRQLPLVMLPSTFVVLSQLPRTPSGKIDRQALPMPAQTRLALEPAFVAPRTPTEEALAGIWAGVLNVAPIGIHNNFFDLGGHSLMAVQMMSRLRVTLQVDVPLRSLFDAPTVAGLALHVEVARRESRGVLTPPMASRPRQSVAPLSVVQEQLWGLDQVLPNMPFFNLSCAMRLTGVLHVATLERSLNEMIGRHDVLRTTVVTVDGRPVQAIAPTLHLPLTVDNLQVLPTTEREIEAQRLARDESLQPFNLAQGPLLRVRLLQVDEQASILLLTMHHIISDRWSIGILAQELTLLYNAFAAGKPSPLPALPMQYADFAYWQRQWRHSEAMDVQLAYWNQQLRDPLPVLELPTDRPRTTALNLDTARQSRVIPGTLSDALQRLSRREGCSLFMTLLAGFTTLLHSYTGQDDLLVGTLLANRNRQEIEGLIGLFINTVFLRTNLGGNPSLQQVLRRVRETTLAAYTYQDLPFEDLVRTLERERHLQRTSLCQVMFILQNAVPQPPPLPALTLSLLEADEKVEEPGLRATTFDLVLVMRETPQGLAGSCLYKPHLFDVATICRMLEDFQHILQHFVSHPEQPLSTFGAPGHRRG